MPDSLNYAINRASTLARKRYTPGDDQRIFIYRDREYTGKAYSLMTSQDYYGYLGIGIDEQDVKALVFYGNGNDPEPPQLDIEYY